MSQPEAKKILLVTIATLGCGKTTVGDALHRLYGARMGHIQNDEIPRTSGNQKRLFVAGIKELLAEHSVVLADRNNAEKREREQLFADVAPEFPDVLFVALNFLPRGPTSQARRRTGQLVRARKSHSTIHSMPDGMIEMIMRSTYKRFEPVDPRVEPDSRFDAVIDLTAGDSLPNIRRVLAELAKLGVPSAFSDDAVTAAYEAALDYEPKYVAPVRVRKNRPSRDHAAPPKRD